MRELVIEYVFEGHKRGYNFTSPTNGFNDDTLKTVWRNAMPRGQGWGADLYISARSLKSFRLPDGRIALSESVVTGLRDESGRGGIRRTEVQIMQPGEYGEALVGRLRQYPEVIYEAINRKPHFVERRKIPKVRGDDQVILSSPYESLDRWQWMEAVLLKAAIDELGKRWLQGRVITFTTLALEYKDESQIIGMPEHKVNELGIESYPLRI